MNVLRINGQIFEPSGERITLYGCGPTVYAAPHVGNLRAAVVADLVFRVLRRLYGDRVVFVRNYTDIDDKIMVKMAEQGRSLEEVTHEAITAYEEAMARLNVLSPTHTPRVTENVHEIISFIEELLRLGVAYEQNGSVLFDREKNPRFFLNTNMNPADLPLEPSDYKRHPHDFILWKPVHESKPVGWESPWGLGRPGWHIECSAMIRRYLGDTIDIHLGGLDLLFPHHENECAQSHALTGKPLARHWLHNGLLTMGEKMAKSVGNVVTLEGTGAHPMAVRYFFLMAHYGQPLAYQEEAIGQASEAMNYLSRTLRLVADVRPSDYLWPLLVDLNTPRALAELHGLAREINGNRATSEQKADFVSLMDVLGLTAIPEEPLDPEIAALIEQRNAARARRDFQEADRLRDLLRDLGAKVNDAAL